MRLDWMTFAPNDGAGGAAPAAGADSGADPVPGRDVPTDNPPSEPLSGQDGGSDAPPSETAGAGAEAPGAGGKPADWLTGLPTDLRENKLVSEYGEKGVEALVKDFVNQNAMIGKKGVILPTDKSTPTEIEAFHKAIGRPDKAEDYKVAYPEGYTPSETDKAYQGRMTKAMFEAGVPAAAAEKLMAEHFAALAEAGGESAESAAVSTAELNATIKEKWGADEAANMDLAKRGFVASGLKPEDADKLTELVGGNFALLEHMKKHGAMMQEDGSLPGAGGGGFAGGEAAAKAEIEKMEADAAKDPEHPLRNREHREHQAIIDKRAALYEVAYPNQEAEG